MSSDATGVDSEDDDFEMGEFEEGGEDDENEGESPLSMKIEEPLFSPEELKEREKMRLEMSKCCFQEAWDLYNKLIDPLNTRSQQAAKDAACKKENPGDRVTSFEDRIDETNEDRSVDFEYGTGDSGDQNTATQNQTTELDYQTEDPDDFQNLNSNEYLTADTEDQTEDPEDRNADTEYPTADSECQNAGQGDHDLTTDLTVNRRLRGLEHKYGLFKLTLGLLKEAADPPFLRIEKPRILNMTDRRIRLMQVTRTQYPDLDYAFQIPTTIAVLDWVTVVFHQNFIDPSDTKRAECKAQTEEFPADDDYEIMASDIIDTDDYEDKVELTDYPTDEYGNPLGKTTGTCHFCGEEILPLPSKYQLSVCINTKLFYCCQQYKIMHQEADLVESTIRAENERKYRFIDVSPHARYDPKKVVFPGFGPVKDFKTKPSESKTATVRKKPDDPDGPKVKSGKTPKGKDGEDKAGKEAKEKDGDAKTGKDAKRKSGDAAKTGKDAKGKGGDAKSGKDPKRKSGDVQSGKDGKGKTGGKGKTEGSDKVGPGQAKGKGQQGKGAEPVKGVSKEEMAKKPQKDITFIEKKKRPFEGSDDKLSGRVKDACVDTFDLPWDPYETAFQHMRFFNPDIYDDPVHHVYEQPEIVLVSEELYEDDHRKKTEDLSSLLARKTSVSPKKVGAESQGRPSMGQDVGKKSISSKKKASLVASRPSTLPSAPTRASADGGGPKKEGKASTLQGAKGTTKKDGKPSRLESSPEKK